MCEDAISRQAVAEFLRNHANDFEDVKIRMAFKAASSLVKNADNVPSVTPTPNWIPCGERTPEKGGEYLLWGKISDYDGENYCFLGDYFEFEEKFGIEKSNYDPHTLGFLDTEIDEYYSVIAWMHLPKPYQEEKGEE